MLFIDYLPAELKANKSRWYVSYHVKNPSTGKLHRKTVKVNRIKSITERRRYAQKLVLEINRKLEQGWNPFIEQEAPRGYIKLLDALDNFMKAKTKEFKSKDSIRTYQSHVSTLQNYIRDRLKQPDIFVFMFDNVQVRNYMDYIYNERNIMGTTYNNYKRLLVLMWNWFVENLYCKANPFVAVKNKMEQTKKRQIIDMDTRKEIKNYLTEKAEFEYLAIVMICFHGFIRPKEICLLKPENFIFSKNIIFLSADMCKDKDDRVVTITPDLMEALKRLNIQDIKKDLYVFSENFKPGKKLIDSRVIGKRWDKLRKELKMPMEYQFYSLKDSGIVQKLQDGVNPLDIRNQAGHSSLEQTNQYAKYANPNGSEQMRNNASDF